VYDDSFYGQTIESGHWHGNILIAGEIVYRGKPISYTKRDGDRYLGLKQCSGGGVFVGELDENNPRFGIETKPEYVCKGDFRERGGYYGLQAHKSGDGVKKVGRLDKEFGQFISMGFSSGSEYVLNGIGCQFHRDGTVVEGCFSFGAPDDCRIISPSGFISYESQSIKVIKVRKANSDGKIIR